MKKDKIILILFCIFLPILLVLFSYKMVLLFSTLTENQLETMNYFNGKKPLELDYTDLEKSHLEDVKQVMKRLDYVFYLSLLICTLIFTYHKRDKIKIKKLFYYGGVTILVSLGILLLLLIINFNYVFTSFHEIFFPQGNWIFSASSLIIQTFPLDFFINISIKITILTLLIAVIVIYKTKKFK